MTTHRFPARGTRPAVQLVADTAPGSAAPALAAAFTPSASPAERTRALVDALPPPLRRALDGGTVERRSRFAEQGGADVVELWIPPPGAGAHEAALARTALAELHATVLAPADPERLLARVLALLSHYPAKDRGGDVEAMLALDWAEDLGEFPAWAVDQAARTWRRTQEWRPSIARMRALCQDACAAERRLSDRLAALARRSDGQVEDAAPPRHGLPSATGVVKRFGGTGRG